MFCFVWTYLRNENRFLCTPDNRNTGNYLECWCSERIRRTVYTCIRSHLEQKKKLTSVLNIFFKKNLYLAFRTRILHTRRYNGTENRDRRRFGTLSLFPFGSQLKKIQNFRKYYVQSELKKILTRAFELFMKLIRAQVTVFGTIAQSWNFIKLKYIRAFVNLTAEKAVF